MRLFTWTLLNLTLLGGLASAQSTFAVTGTAIPADLLQQNYGKLPKGVAAYDLNICNLSNTRQSIVSSEIFQALAQSNIALQPIGRQIMLAAILRNQNRSVGTVLPLALNSVMAVLSVLSSAKYSVPPGVLTGAALGSISVQQLLGTLKPVLSADQLEKFDGEVLQSALVLDSGSCAERTVFTSAAPSHQAKSLSFHVR